LKIGSSHESRQAADQLRPKDSAPRPAGSGASTGPAAEVRLSDLSTRLADLESRLSTTDAFDQKRVDEIKQAISEGRFKVDSGAVADKLIENVREMLTGRTRPAT